MMRRIRAIAILAGLVLMLGTAPAFAHKMKVFASAEGATISGYVYFNSGNRAVGVRIDVADRAGTTLYTGTSDADGAFRFEATRRTDHVISAAGEDGHAATYIVPASELPDSLPAPPDNRHADTIPTPSAASVVLPESAHSTEMRAMIEQSVARQIRPLREQIDSYQEKIWWHDVLGGIGYIVGLGGLAFGLTRRRAAPSR